MKDFIIGAFVLSKAGRDSGKCYVIFHIENEYVYLVDGKFRMIDRPKKKKKKHVEMFSYINQDLVDKVNSKTVKNEEIKRGIKLMQNVNSSKEVE
ncbi:KOW domain-containing RNA-binding protein [Mobilitalea sibirica]|uniref:KOW domain-containing RNA-binding protein n=1 Tax=Mobilitalea sibirica TaxID=1462919 RepID=A0A8J7H9Y4_9FIRM|nr:KOW domain-containing RNA-binding protein [Mobilitalea sibirica]MBH1941240.1 KOW domain-containing RNA-binding protein [Mobilitalea sibirica]